jgi:hypothetical protein
MSDWPAGMAIRPIVVWPTQLTPRRKSSNFAAPWASTLALLRRELRELGAKNAVLQIAMREGDFRLDGYPRAQAKAEHPGVIISLDSRYGPLSYPCDAFTTWQDNVRAIAAQTEETT